MKKRNKLSIPYAFQIGAISVRWPTVLLGSLAAVALTFLYTFRVRRFIPPGPAEQASLNSLQSFSNLLENPLLFAYKLPATVLQQIINNDLLASRLAAVVLALICCALFYLLARRWYGRLYGAGITALFATSSWMLHTGRYAAGYIVLILLVLTLLNTVIWVNNSERSNLVIPIFALVCGLALFAPGGIWFAIAATAMCWHALREHIESMSIPIRLVAAGIFGVLLLAVVGACLRSPDIIRQLAGLPEHFPGLMDMVKQAALSISAFVARGPGTQEVWLSHTPVLDVASSALLLLGVIFYARFLRKSRTLILLAFSGIGAVLVTLHGAPALGYLVPIVYLVIGAGLSYLMQQWKKVFPRNPIAEATALTVVGLLMLCIVAFHMQRYFNAWRYSPVTVELYSQPPAEAKLPYLIQ